MLCVFFMSVCVCVCVCVFVHRPTILCVVYCALVKAVSVYKTSLVKGETDQENEMKTVQITAMLFNFVFLCLFW